jgi:hypothetical protein
MISLKQFRTLATSSLIVGAVCLMGQFSETRGSATYLGLIYREATAKSLGLPFAPGGYLVWFLKDAPSNGGAVGGSLMQYVPAIVPAPGRNFLVAAKVPPHARAASAAEEVLLYNPRKNAVVSSVRIPGFRIAFNLREPVQLGSHGKLWALGFRDAHLSLYCLDFHTGRELGSFVIPGGKNGAEFWLARGGALIATAASLGPGARIGALFFTRANGRGSPVAIPRGMGGFPPWAVVQHDRLSGVNYRWRLVTALVGKNGQLQHVSAKKIKLPGTTGGRPGYFFSLGRALAVVSPLGQHHRYIMVVSERNGAVLATRKVSMLDSPIGATNGRIYCLTSVGTIDVFNSDLKRLEKIRYVPTYEMLQGDAAGP